jgi:hypothetical protein
MWYPIVVEMATLAIMAKGNKTLCGCRLQEAELSLLEGLNKR